MSAFMRFYLTTEQFVSQLTIDELARTLVTVANEHGYGTTVRSYMDCDSCNDGTVVTVFAPDDGENPLPWGMNGHTLSGCLTEIIQLAESNTSV